MHQNPTENNNAAGETPPEPADTSATAAHRVAVFQCGDEDMVQAVVHAGLEIAYLYDAGFGTEHLDFDDIPPFDLVAAVLPDGASDLRRESELVLLFIRARTPISFVLAVRDQDGAAETLRDLGEKTPAARLLRQQPARSGWHVLCRWNAGGPVLRVARRGGALISGRSAVWVVALVAAVLPAATAASGVGGKSRGGISSPATG